MFCVFCRKYLCDLYWNGIIWFFTPNNMCIDTKIILILCVLTEISIKTRFSVMAALICILCGLPKGDRVASSRFLKSTSRRYRNSKKTLYGRYCTLIGPCHRTMSKTYPVCLGPIQPPSQLYPNATWSAPYAHPLQSCCLNHSPTQPSASELSAAQLRSPGTLSHILLLTATCLELLNLTWKHFCSAKHSTNSYITFQQRLWSYDHMAL